MEVIQIIKFGVVSVVFSVVAAVCVLILRNRRKGWAAEKVAAIHAFSVLRPVQDIVIGIFAEDHRRSFRRMMLFAVWMLLALGVAGLSVPAMAEQSKDQSFSQLQELERAYPPLWAVLSFVLAASPAACWSLVEIILTLQSVRRLSQVRREPCLTTISVYDTGSVSARNKLRGLQARLVRDALALLVPVLFYAGILWNWLAG